MVKKTSKGNLVAVGVSTLAMTLAFTGVSPVTAQGVVTSSVYSQNESAPAVLSLLAQSVSEDAYAVRGVHNGRNVISSANANHYETEHFQFLWGNGGDHEKVTEALLAGNAKILEDCWALYMNQLQMTEPAYSVNEYGTDTKKYKVNVVILGTDLPLYEGGYAYSGLDSQGYPYLMTSPDAMYPKAAEGLAIPHEFGHVVQFAQGNNSWGGNEYLGPWFEPVANWFREEYMSSDAYKQDTGTAGGTDLSGLYLRATTLTAANGRAYYEAWPLLMYLEDNPDELPGYGTGFIAKLLQSGRPENQTESIYELIQRCNPETTLQDTIGHFASRMATFDFHNKELYKRKVEVLLRYGNLYWQQYYTMLEKVEESANTYTIPSERAPQAAGYNIIPLDVNLPADASSVTVKVKLDGLTEEEGAGWQAYLIVENESGESRYSKVFGSGESVQEEVFNGENAYLSVAATPTLTSMENSKIGIASWNKNFSENTIPFEMKPQYPYQITLENATPQQREIEVNSNIKGHRHNNGGGFVANSAQVDESVYVGEDAMVLDSAIVTGNARIEDSAIVRGAAKVGGSAKILDHALVQGSARVDGSATLSGYSIADGLSKITDQAHIGGQAIINGEAEVSEYGQVLESALVSGFYTVSGHAVVKGLSICHGGVSKETHGEATGQAITYGDFFDDMGYTITSGSFSGYESIEASVNNFKDGYVQEDGSGGYVRP